MKFRGFWNKYGNCIVVILTILVNVIAMSLIFDFYYDLNDDVMMKDVMAGVYAGVPDGHNMQTLYVLGAFISLLYRLGRGLPWYGLFLCLCQFGSLFLVGYRMLSLLQKWQAKAAAMVLLTLFIWGVLLPHMVALQYTLTCTMLAAAAIFLFMTTKKGLPVKRFIIYNIPSILLVVLAYQLRSEMLLLVFPLICLAGLYRWLGEDVFFQKENYFKYGVIIGCILAGMLFSRLIDFAAYGSGGWKEAVDFFNARTEVYDFHYDILTSGEHSEFLSSIGLGSAKQELLANYNFGLDEDIDENTMAEIAKYAASDVKAEQSFTKLILKKSREYFYRTLHGGDSPYNLLVITGYVCIFVSGLSSIIKGSTDKKRWLFLLELFLLGIFRSVLWMYIMIKGRDPERITHSLYIAEGMVLMGMLFVRRVNIISPVFSLLMVYICFANLESNVVSVWADGQIREEANRGADAIAQYCRANPENFYFEDVYSTVGFSQKIFKNVDNSLTNYDIMGGWMCKTPLYDEKLSQFGLENTQDGLLSEDGVYFIIEAYTDVEWIIDYYYDKGYNVFLRQIDLIDDKYVVYQIVEE